MGFIIKHFVSNINPLWVDVVLGNFLCSAGTAAAGSVVLTVAAGQSQGFSFITPVGVPASHAWENSVVQTVNLRIVAGSVDLSAKCQVAKLGMYGRIIEKGAYTPSLVLDQDRTFNPACPVWSEPSSCEYRLGFYFLVTNGDGVNDQSFTFGCNLVTDLITSLITENTEDCVHACNCHYS